MAAFASTFSLIMFLLGAVAFLLRADVGTGQAAVPETPSKRRARVAGTARASAPVPEPADTPTVEPDQEDRPAPRYTRFPRDSGR